MSYHNNIWKIRITYVMRICYAYFSDIIMMCTQREIDTLSHTHCDDVYTLSNNVPEIIMTHTHTRTRTHTHTRQHTHHHTHTHTNMLTRTHTHTHTYCDDEYILCKSITGFI